MVSVRALRGAVLNRRKWCGIPAPASPFSQRRTRLSPMVLRSTAALGAFVPHTLDRNNRQSDMPDRASLPRKRAKRYRRHERKKEARGGPNSPPSSDEGVLCQSTKAELAHDLLEPHTLLCECPVQGSFRQPPYLLYVFEKEGANSLSAFFS